MKTAFEYLEEWVGSEDWKIHIINNIKQKEKIDSLKLLDEIIDIIENEKVISKIQKDILNDKEESALVIDEIKNPTNINALFSDVELKLGEKLNVIYGENGSGKSSYVRMFRKLAENYFTTEKSLTVLPNVYDSKIDIHNLKQSVEISYRHGNKNLEEIIDINNQHEILKNINVYDNDSLIALINTDLNFSMLPIGFENFKNVSQLLDELRELTKDKINMKKSKASSIFEDTSYEFIEEEINQIKHNVGNYNQVEAYIKHKYHYNDETYKQIKKLYDESKSLDKSSRKDKLLILNSKKNILKGLLDSLNILSSSITIENIQSINKLIEKYDTELNKEQENILKYKRTISYLEEINQTWENFIRKGKEYYESTETLDGTLGEPCIFCSQTLHEDGVSTISNHFEHLESDIESSKTNSKLIEYEIKENGLNITEEDEIYIDNNELVTKIRTVIQIVNDNIKVFNNSLKNKTTVKDDIQFNFQNILKDLITESNKIEEQITDLEKSEEGMDSKVINLKDKIIILEKNKKINESLSKFIEWFTIQRQIETLNFVKNKFTTTTLTQKQNEAFSNIVREEYTKTFSKYKSQLNVPDIELKIIPRKGDTYRNKTVSADNYKVSEIMSEGEQKAIAMAEFTTDITMRNDFNPILFDDPVTSLDYKRSELFANLITELSKTRQVIVFTHDIMFFYNLYNASKKDKLGKFYKVDPKNKYSKGIITESFSGRLENLKSILGKLRKQQQEIDSDNCFGDVLEEKLEIAYSDIRTWCELIIEEGFFRSIITRLRLNVMFTNVDKVNPEFVNELSEVKDIFDKACRWMKGHSQSDISQFIKPDKEIFQEHMEYIIRITKKYNQDYNKS